MTDLESIIYEYKNSVNMTEKEKAMVERQIWFSFMSANPNSKVKKRDYLQEKIGGTLGEYDIRSSLVSAGSCINGLWARLDKDMSIYTAIAIYRDSKRKLASKSAEPSEKDILEALKEYDNRPYERDLGNGKISRSTSQYSKRDAPVKENTEDSKKFWQQIRNLSESFVAKKLSEVDHYLQKDILDEFEVSIRDSYDQLLKRINKHRRDVTLEKRTEIEKIGKIRFTTACEVLSLSGLFGKPIDLKLAKKYKLLRLRDLHPDLHGGQMNDSQKNEFEAVLQAYDLLEQYNTQFKQGK